MAGVKEKSLLVLKRTRKAYLIEYVCGVVLLTGLGFLSFQGVNLSKIAQNFTIVMALFAFASAEFSRLFTRYRITESKIIIIKGLIKQAKKNVYFHPLGFVPDLNVHQDRIGRLLGYGTIYLKTGSGDNTFEIRDVNRPHKILEMIEQLIEHHKSGMGGGQQSKENE